MCHRQHEEKDGSASFSVRGACGSTGSVDEKKVKAKKGTAEQSGSDET
jgi:hypothetical protein